MSHIVLGPRTWKGSRDSDGHRTYNVVYRIELDNDRLGPAAALQCPGLPLPGSWWIIRDDIDLWAWCRWDGTMDPYPSDAVVTPFWDIGFVFSTKPPTNQGGGGGKPSYCKDFQVEDPLLEPYKISGGTVKDKEEAQTDRFGLPLLTSSWEQIRGPQVEFDKNHDQVRVEFNVAVLNLNLCLSAVNCVNAYPLWGCNPRQIKLSQFDWEKKYYGNCFPYYTRKFEFELNSKGFDRNIIDRGTLVLGGQGSHWDTTTGSWIPAPVGGSPANPNNPTHFMRAVDRHGNPLGQINLNGRGMPALSITGSGRLYYSLVDGNTNKPLSNPSYWAPINRIPVTGDDWARLEWQDEDPLGGVFGVYPFGAIVSIVDPVDFIRRFYACIVNGATTDPESITGGPDDEWKFLGALGTFHLTNKGNYNSATTYATGDYVRDLAGTGVGCRHVEKYDAFDFLLLGIPATF